MTTRKEAVSASRHAIEVNTKKAHLAAAKANAAYCDTLMERMSARGQGYSRTLGYHDAMEEYHKAVAKGNKNARPPLKYNPRNDPGSRSYVYEVPYYD